MFKFLAVLASALFCVYAQNFDETPAAKANSECDIKRDNILVQDQDAAGTGLSYLTCRPTGVGTRGFWQRKLCPASERFDFANQMCSDLASVTSGKKVAALNQSCALGEHCTGGAVCDLVTVKCLCPAGTRANPVKLSCEQMQVQPTEAPVLLNYKPKPMPKNVVAPGSSCRNGETCGGNSFCSNFVGVCMCPENTQDRAGVCVLLEPEKVELGAQCVESTQCPANAQCIHGVCDCPKPLVQNGDGCVQITTNTASRTVGPGESCANGEVCMSGSVCNPFAKRCMCPVGTIKQEKRCIQKTLLGVEGGKVDEKCQLNTDCMIGAYCNANVARCQCLSTHVDVSGMCYRVIRPGQDGCEHDAQCGAAYGGAVCQNRLCICPEGTNAQGQTCRPKADMAFPGERCLQSTCLGGSTCINSICECPPGLTIFQKQCLHNDSILLPLGSPCFPGMICDDNAVCLSGVCQCDKDKEPRGNICVSRMHRFRADMSLQQVHLTPDIHAEDLLGVPLGFFCLPEQLTCAKGNGTCIDGLCQCPSDFLAINGSCLSIMVGPGQRCAEQKGQQCTGGSLCRHGLCRCPTGTIDTKGRCSALTQVRAAYGQYCTTNEVCTGDSLCIGGVCECPNGWTFENGRCKSILYTAIGTRCTPFESCSGGARCISGYCTCTDGSFQSGSMCEQNPGGSCSAGQVCIGGSSCQFGVCRCPGGKQPMNNRCDSKTSTGPGDSCDDGEVCIGGSRCVFGVCLCPQDWIAVGTTCVPKDQNSCPNEDCSRGQQCQGGSVCLSGICKCPSNEPVANCQCQTPGNLTPGKPCTIGQQCTGNSICSRNLCRCQSGQTIDSTTNSCRFTNIPALPGQICSGTQVRDCVGESFCISNICQCIAGQTIINNECSSNSPAVAYPDESCASGQTCIGGSSCQSGICRCPPGYANINRNCQRLTTQKRPGDVCSAGDVCTGGSTCLGNFCTCPTGQVAINYVCSTTTPGPGQVCSPQQVCSGGSVCFENVCRCPTGYIILSGRCRLARVPPGQTCVPGQQCTGGSNCINSICECLQTQIAIDGVCQTKPVGPGESCRNGERCTGGSTCVLPQALCQCPQGIPVDGVCPTQAKPGEPCSPTATCVSNALCTNGLCTCQIGFLSLNGQCVRFPTANPGQSCAGGEICLGGSSCQTNMCRCPVGQTILNNQCVTGGGRTANPGESCAAGQQCQGGSYCISNVCKCPSNTVQVGTLCQTNVPTAYPGQSCAQGQQCLGGSYCVSVTCTCPIKTIQVGLQCQKQTVSPGEACTSISTCDGGSACVNGICRCPSNHVIFNGQCIPNNQPMPGDRCTPTQTCMGGSTCSSVGICTCPQGTEAISGRCMSVVPPGSSCAQGQQCGGGSQCQNGFCICPIGTTPINGRCQVNSGNIPPGGQCGQGLYCVSNSYCSSTRTCICNSGTVQLGNQCKYISAPGTSCAGGRVCTGGATCVSEICQCPGTSVIRNQQCVTQAQSSKPGEPCSISQLCTGNAICQSGICRCRVGDIQSGFQCVKASFPNEPCNMGQVCMGGARCNSQVCSCPTGTVAANDYCYPRTTVAYPGGTCFHSELCVGSSVCRSSSCVCPPGSNPVNSECQLPATNVYPGGSCTYSYQCQLGLTCMYGICKCVQLSGPNCPGRGKTSSPPGGSCAALQQCTGGSSCRDGWCVCPDPNMVVTRGICTVSAGNGGRPQIVPQTKIEPATIISEVVPGSICGENVQCIGGSSCVGGQCLCPTGQIILGEACVIEETKSIVKPVKRLKPNDPCSRAGEVCEGGSICDGIMCKCAPGTQLQDGLCLAPAVANPGQSCANGETCTGGSACQAQHKVCTCPLELPEILNGQCIAEQEPPEPQIALPNSPCDFGVQCIGGSNCNPSTQLCECPADTIAVAGLCQAVQTTTKSAIQIAQPEDDCDPTFTQCTGGARCSPATLRCECPATMIAKDGQCQNRPAVITEPTPTAVEPKSRSMCSSDLDCPLDRVCITSQCICKPGYIETNGRCRAIQGGAIPLGEICAPGDTCAGEAQCINGLCECGPGFVPDDSGNCIAVTIAPTTQTTTEQPQLGHFCTIGQFCGPRAECRDGFCQCMGGFVQEGTECIATSALQPTYSVPGEPCSDGQICMGSAICHFGFCVCPYFTKSYNMRCLGSFDPQAFSSPGDPCTGIQDCTGGSVCTFGFCVCPAGTDSINMQCVQRRISSNTPGYSSPGHSCKFGERCTGRSYCVDNICTCPAGMRSSNGVCTGETLPPASLEPASPGKECSPGQACLGGSLCTDGICLCPQFMRIQNERCVPIQTTEPFHPINDGLSECTADIECSYAEWCVLGVCECLPGHVRIDSNCLPGEKPRPVVTPAVVTANPGEACANGQLCTGGSICDSAEKTCRCAAKHEIVAGICTNNAAKPKIVGPGEACVYGEVCGGGSECTSDGYCTCPDPYYNDKGVCRKITGTADGETPNEVGVRNRMPAIQVQPTRTPRIQPQAHQGKTPTAPSGKAQLCPLPENPSSCQLPYCFCSKTGREIPGGLAVNETPQFVILQFDDAVNGKNIDFYKTLLDNHFTNRNGCPIHATFFVSHEWTNYDSVQWLASQGHEIASNSITHRPMRRKKFSRWIADMDGQRQIISKLASVPANEITGIRAPQLSVAGDAQFQMMQTAGFEYDNSISANPGRVGEPFWPQTLDYAISWECQNEECPTSSFPGIWEVPLNQFYGYYLPRIKNYKRSSMLRGALSLNETMQSVLEVLRGNFKRAYESNKAPYVMALNADFLYMLDEGAVVTALKTFLRELKQYNDVWFVTMAQLVDWMREPRPMSEMGDFACVPGSNTPPPCESGNRCMYKTPNMMSPEHQFNTCNTCPRMYPWLDNPLGQ